MKELGEIKTLENKDKLYLLTSGAPAGGVAPDRPLATVPVTVPAGGEVTVRITIGDDIAKAVAENKIERIDVQTISPDCGDYNNYAVASTRSSSSGSMRSRPNALKPEAVSFSRTREHAASRAGGKCLPPPRPPRRPPDRRELCHHQKFQGPDDDQRCGDRDSL